MQYKLTFYKNKNKQIFLPHSTPFCYLFSDILGNDQDIADAHQKLVSVVATFNGYNNGIDSLREDDALADQKRKDFADKLEESADSLKGGFLGRAFGGKKDD